MLLYLFIVKCWCEILWPDFLQSNKDERTHPLMMLLPHPRELQPLAFTLIYTLHCYMWWAQELSTQVICDLFDLFPFKEGTYPTRTADITRRRCANHPCPFTARTGERLHETLLLNACGFGKRFPLSSINVNARLWGSIGSIISKMFKKAHVRVTSFSNLNSKLNS